MRTLNQALSQKLVLLGWAWLLMMGALSLSANETDNFYLPLDAEMADIGPFLETVHTMALEQTVAEVNARIEKALRSNDEDVRAASLQQLHDPLVLAKVFLRLFGHPMFEDHQAEHALGGAWAHKVYIGQEASHQDLGMNFSAPFLLDLRRLGNLNQSRTVKAYGVYFGTDKLVHFHHLGEAYYQMYSSLVRKGASKETAYQQVVRHYAESGVLSEKGIFGDILAGIYSNADLAVNHVGFRFYMNLTERVALKGEEQEPLLLRSGSFWRLNRHVRPRSGWFRIFLSDHWNEALNPNLYQGSIRSGIHRVLQNRAKHIVQFYTEKDGRPREPKYFENLARELSTYYGEPYGHSGHFDKILTIGNTCFPALQAAHP